MAHNIKDSLAIEEIYCSICRELYTSPVDLPCGHTFCLACLKNWSAFVGEHMSCPLCRHQSITAGIETLPKNEFIECLVDLKSNDHCQICCHCEKCCICEIRCIGEASSIAKWRCLHCQQNICEDDCKRHKRLFTTKGHKIIKIIDFMQRKDNSICEKPDRCRIHPELDVSLYCADCRETLCVNCLVETHKTHRFDKLENKANECKEFILKDIDKVVDATSVACDEHLKILQDEKELILETVRNIENSVNKHFQKTLKILERVHEELCSKLKNIKELKLKKMAENKNELESCLTELKGLRMGVDKLIDQSSFSDLVCNPPPFLSTISDTLQGISQRNVLNSEIFREITFYPPNFDFRKLVTDHNVFGEVDEVDQSLISLTKVQSKSVKKNNDRTRIGQVKPSLSQWWAQSCQQRMGSQQMCMPRPQMDQRSVRPVQMARPITGNSSVRGPQQQQRAVMPATMMATGAYRKSLAVRPQPLTVHISGQEPLTASLLAEAPLQEQKQMLGERLFPRIHVTYPELAGKITGMLLEMDNSELLHMLESRDYLEAKVEEAIAVLQAHQMKEAAGVTE